MKIFMLIISLWPIFLFAEQVEILDTGDKIFRSKMDIIENAKEGEPLLCADFLYRGDLSSKMKLVALMDAAQRGAVSYNIVDAPHFLLPPAYVKIAEDAGVKFKIFSPVGGWNKLKESKRYHVKLTATEDAVHSGGTNTGNEYFGMSEDNLVLNDRDARMKGPDIWRSVKENFMTMWNDPEVVDIKVSVLTKEEMAERQAKILEKSERMKKVINLVKKFGPLEMDAPDPSKGTGREYVTQEDLDAAREDLNGIRKKWQDYKVAKGWDQPAEWFKDSSPNAVITMYTDEAGKKGKTIGAAEGIYNLLKRAKKSVVISTPYFILTEPMKKALAETRKRGVKITWVTNSATSADNKLAQAGYYRDFQYYAKTGDEIYEYNGTETLHAKNIVIDGEVVDEMIDDGSVYKVGSYNMDPRSENLNHEIVFTVEHDPKNSKLLIDGINRDIQRSTLVAKGGKVIVEPSMVCEGFFKNLFMIMVKHQL